MGLETWVAIGKFFGAVLFGTATTAPAWAVWGARIALLAISSKVLAPKIDLTQTAQEKKLTVRDPIYPQAVVYGQDILSGPLFIANTTGTDNKYLTLGVLLTGHEIDSFVEFRLDDTTITSGEMSAFPSGNVTGGKFANVAEVSVELGTATQTENTLLSNNFGSLWTTAHRLRGWSYMAWRFQLVDGNNAFQTGAPANIKAVIKGKKVYDPRLDDTNGGTGPHRLATPSTWEWSANPALCLADFLRDDTFGMKEVDDRIDWPLVITAADICDAQVAIPVASTQNRYTCNFTFRADESRGSVVDAILESMLGRLVFSQGVWRMWAGAAVTADVTLTEANLAGAIQVQATAGAKERYNRVRGKYIDPAREYSAQSYVEQKSASYETDDGGEVRPLVADWSTCNNEYEAQRNAIITLKQSRQQRVVVFQGNMSCFRLQPGTTVNLSIAEYGFSGDKFFISDWIMNDQGVSLTLVEEVDSAWTAPAEGDYSTRTPTGVIVAGSPVTPAPDNLTATGIQNGVKLTWTAPAFAEGYVAIEVWQSYENVRGTATLVNTVTKPATTAYDFTTDNNRKRYYWIRAVDEFGTVSAWEPNLTTTTASAFPAQNEFGIVGDPFIRRGTAYWDSDPVGSTGSTTYVIGGGSNGTDCIRMTAPGTPGGGIFVVAQDDRLGPEEWDVVTQGNWAVEVTWRFRIQTHGVGPTYDISFDPVAYTYDEDGLDRSNWGVTADADVVLDENTTAGVWYTDSRIIQINDANIGKTGLRHFRVGIKSNQTGGYANLDGTVVEVDYLSAQFAAKPFTGANKDGLVPAPGTAAGKYLKDDGTWDNPPGGSASNSFETMAVTDTDSGYTWAETGSAVAESATDTLTLVSGANIDLDVDAALDAIRVSATGDVAASGTPLNDQVAIWTDANTIEGVAALTYETTNGLQVTDDVRVKTGNAFYIFDSANTNYVSFALDGPGTSVAMTSSGVNQFAFPLGMKLLLSSVAARAGLNIDATGTPPSSPVNGDVWADGATFNIRAGNVTKDLMAGGNVTSITAGNGMDFTEITNSGDVTLGIPGTLDNSSTNQNTATSHFHQLNGVGFTNQANSWSGQQSFTGLILTAASDSAEAGLRIPHGAAPTSPVNGDIWSTSAGMFARINGTTVQLDASSGGGTTEQTYNATGNTSGATVQDHEGSSHDVGFNVLHRATSNNSDFTLGAEECGQVWDKTNSTARTITLADSTDLDFPVDGVITLMNKHSSGDVTITEGTGTTLYYMEPGVGRTDTAGGCTLGPGGVATIRRASSTSYDIWGSAITP